LEGVFRDSHLRRKGCAETARFCIGLIVPSFSGTSRHAGSCLSFAHGVEDRSAAQSQASRRKTWVSSFADLPSPLTCLSFPRRH
jgi:hypothetical protein